MVIKSIRFAHSDGWTAGRVKASLGKALSRHQGADAQACKAYRYLSEVN